ncbi:MAG TPA: hypothetical protein VN622_07500 [Clostridia bacterium]|nr:hypothetical protein [Clostridia bacterium]
MANFEMDGVGTFFNERFDDAVRCPPLLQIVLASHSDGFSGTNLWHLETAQGA